MGSFEDLFKSLSSIPGRVEEATQNGLNRGAVIVKRRAQGKLGSYQGSSGSYPAWVKLKPETVKRKHMGAGGKLKQGGKKYLKLHGSWGAGGNDDSPLVGTSGHLRIAITTDSTDLDHGMMYVGVAHGEPDEKGSAPGDYAAAHEFGYEPKGIPARPYLRPALEESREEIKEAVTQELLKGLRSL